MKHGSLFSGIGGFDLAAQWMGWENAFHCEISEFPRKVLHHYWPNALSYENIKETDFTKWRGKIDVISGGFPCQPYSLAGKRLGKEDDRHLWPEMLRCIREIKPRWVVGENVFGIVNWNGGLVFDEVQADLEAEGYEVQAYVLPACAVNAPHRRDRVWFVAYAAGNGTPQNGRSGANEGGREASIFSQNEGRESKTIQPAGLCCLQRFVAHANNSGSEKSIVQHSDLFAGSVGNNEQTTSDPTGNQNQRHGQGGFFTEPAGVDEQGDAADTENSGQQTRPERPREKQFRRRDEPMGPRQWDRFPTQSPVCRRNDGLSSRLDGITFSKWRNESIKAYGNAVVPQVVYQIFKVIEAYEPY